jgi:hypothetical protein
VRGQAARLAPMVSRGELRSGPAAFLSDTTFAAFPELESRIAARWDDYGIGISYLNDERRELLTMEQLSKRLPDL